MRGRPARGKVKQRGDGAPLEWNLHPLDEVRGVLNVLVVAMVLQFLELDVFRVIVLEERPMGVAVMLDGDEIVLAREDGAALRFGLLRPRLPFPGRLGELAPDVRVPPWRINVTSPRALGLQ